VSSPAPAGTTKEVIPKRPPVEHPGGTQAARVHTYAACADVQLTLAGFCETDPHHLLTRCSPFGDPDPGQRHSRVKD
jgi:hypothetical protein